MKMLVDAIVSVSYTHLMDHCSLMDEETAQMIIDHDVYVVPTFCPYEEAVHYDPVMIQTKQNEYRCV